MRKLFLLLGFISLTLWSSAQDGWRAGEMEVKIFLHSTQQAEILHQLNLNTEAAAPGGTVVNVYVTPEELESLKENGFDYKITIPDLNSHYMNFWNSKVPSGYMTYEQIVALADSLDQNFPSICKKVIFGTSVGGRQLGALKISDNVDIDESEAGILFDGGIHGDEIMGPEILIRYARYLCLGYNNNPVYTDLINTREIWLYYMANPDGRVNMSRYNNNNVDCNRDAGYMWNAEGNSNGAFSQVESRSLRNCMLQVNPVVYTNFHGGTEIISYPWSYRTQPSPDNAHLDQLASVYSISSGYSNLPYGQGYNIMYPINGSYKDFQYGSIGNVGWSIEITMDKQPPSASIPSYYQKNEPAITEMITRCGFGAEGIVTDSVTGEPVAATIWIDDFYPVFTRPGIGDYHKYILPGTHTLKVTANGYASRNLGTITVPDSGSVVTNVKMVRQTGRYAVQVLSNRIPLSSFASFTNAAYTPGTSGSPDGVYYSLWKNGWIILDMGDTIFNGPGNDFRVYEGNSDIEGFKCYVSTTKDGPWIKVGATEMGTTYFDLAAAQGGAVAKTRFIKIVDDNDGPTSGTDLGFDLDAVEMITQPLIADFTVSETNPCGNAGIEFTDFSAGTPTSWSWSFPGATPSVSTEQNPQGISYAIPGTYDVTLTVTNSYCSSTKTRTDFITIKDTPIVFLGNDTAIEASQNIVLDAGNPGCTYFWSTGETTQSITADSTGVGYGTEIYYVDVVNSIACVGHDQILITFTYPSGTNEKDQLPVAVYPNPAKEFINIENQGKQNLQVRLLSQTGIIILEKEILPGHDKLQTRNLPRGVYLLELRTEGRKEIRKIILN